MTQFDPNKPYNALPDIPPPHDVESKTILKACIEARSNLAELKQVAAMLPNQAVLINTLPILEAQASSEIENIVTTTDKLFQFANTSEHQADPATKEALRYRTALKEGFESIARRPLSTATAIDICSRIKQVDMGIRAIPGTTINNQATGEVVYTPPVGKSLLQDKLKNWETFIHYNDDLDPLVKMAISHYQFEAIHPFTDGNGRTGRILNILFLIEQDLLTIPVLYLSRHIIGNKADYYQLLLAVTCDGAWEAWIMYMLTAVKQTAQWTSEKIRGILQLMQATRSYFKANLPTIYTRELADLIFTQPYCRIGNITEAGIAKRQTASHYLKCLCDVGILVETRMGREKLFINPRFVHILSHDGNAYSPLGSG